jgi:O-antigen/teichoic acid export membrane protein
MSSSIFRGAAYLTAVELVVKARGLIILPLLTKYLGAEQFGIWSQTSAIAATVTPLIVLGTDSAVIRYLPGMSETSQQRFFVAWLLAIMGAALGAAGLLMLAPEAISGTFFGNGDFTRFIFLAGLVLVVTLGLNCLRNWFRIRNETRAFGAVAAIQAMVSLAALALGIVQAVPLESLILYAVVADLLVALGCSMHILRRIGRRVSPDFSLLGKLLRYGLPLVPASFAMWGMNYLGRLFLVQYGTLEEVGIYAVVCQIGMIAVQFLVNPIWTMYASTAAEAHNQGRRGDVQRLFDQSIGAILLVTVPSLVGLLILGKDVLALIASPQYFPGAPLIALVALGYLLHMLASYCEISLGLAHRQHLATVSTVLAFLVNIVASALLIPSYTIAGAALSTALAFATQMAFSMFMAVRLGLLEVRLAYPARVICAAALMGVPLFAADRWISTDVVGFAAKVLVGMIAFALLAWPLRLLPSQLTTRVAKYFHHG